jgi:DNA-binding transcriptional ArsR family regulator
VSKVAAMSEAAEPPTPAASAGHPDELRDVRQLTDPRDMRALAHPIRLALLEVLSVHGPLTATQAGELIGESASSCSFHLRTLARHHFVEETGEGRGRQRPWRIVTTSLNISDVPVGSEKFVAASALGQIFAERQLGRLRQWFARRGTAEQSWVDASAQTEFITWLTPAEVTEINDAVRDALARHHDRLGDPSRRPPGSEIVEMLYFSFPSSIANPAGHTEPEQPTETD